MTVLVRAAQRLDRLMARIGRRGSYLFFLALLDVLYGYSILVPQFPALLGRYDMFFPAVVWGWIWVGVAVILFQQAFVRVDRVGYVFAVVIKFAWAVIALYNFLYLPGDPRGWISAVIWFAFGILTAIVANWPEHTMPRVGAFNGDDNGTPSVRASGDDPD